MRGRKPKPAAVRIAEGNPGHRRINDTIKVPSGRVLCPQWLSTEAKAEWKRIVPSLVESGVMTPIDVNMMARYVYCLACWHEAVAELKAGGTVIEGRASAWVKIRRDLSAEMAKIESEFGMTAASRCRIVVAPTDDKEEPSIEDFAATKPKFLKGSAG